MARMIWLGVGAAGGIYVYRKGGRLVDRAREDGIAAAAVHVARSARAAAVMLAPNAPAPAAPAVPLAPIPADAAAAPERSVRVGRLRVAVAPAPAPPAPAPPPALPTLPAQAAQAAQAQDGVRDTGTIDITKGGIAERRLLRRRKAR